MDIQEQSEQLINSRTCGDCGQPIPHYVGNINCGWIRPTPARKKTDPHTDEERAVIKVSQTAAGFKLEAWEIPLCAECYLKAFAVVNPDQPLPKMPPVLQLD